MNASINKAIQPKNRAPAPIQITAEQILRESKERSVDGQNIKAPRQNITDLEELTQYRMRKRKEFEDSIRRQRQHLGTWHKYAKWEESQKEYERARSIYERALDVDFKSVSLWMKYIEMEMKNKMVNHARNIYDRAVQLLPRVDQFWYKYTYMEEMVGNPKAARTIFERWMRWEPDDNAWAAYVKFEMRQENAQRAREVMERYVEAHPTQRAFLKYARWEEKQRQRPLARAVYERALRELEEGERGEKLYAAFAKFEEGCKEFERARTIYKFALDQMRREEVPELYQAFLSFEKQHGNREGIEEVIINKRRLQYEEAVSASPLDYDAWFDYVRLEEAEGTLEQAREVYERAIAQVPPRAEKRFWRRYIYLWINYALFEELQAQDQDRAREVFRACLAAIPHEAFSFAKVWVLAADLELRRKDLGAARRLLGQALGRCGKEGLFRHYIQLELQMGEIDRCRTLYGKYLEAYPHSCEAWGRFAQLERTVGETARARAVYELAVDQPVLDMPEAVWKAYIDMEVAEGPGGAPRVRALYERLLARTGHVKVWVSFAQFEAQLPPPAAAAAAAGGEGGEEGEGGGGVAAARAVFERADRALKADGLREERVLLLEAWRDVEKEAGDEDGLRAVDARMPKRIKKKRLVTGDAGEELGWEEYYDYAFPDDRTQPQSLKILQMAQKWKEQQAAAAGGGGKGEKRKAEELMDDDEDGNNVGNENKEEIDIEDADDSDSVGEKDNRMEEDGGGGGGGGGKNDDDSEREEVKEGGGEEDSD